MPDTSSTSPYSVIYAFGGSTADAGNVSLSTKGIEPVSPPYYSQTYGSASAADFSNGPVWVQDLSQALGLGQLTPSRTGGTDFAYGGAATGTTPQNAGQTSLQALSLPAQLSRFSSAVGQASASALFTISVGSGDVLSILDGGPTTATQQAVDVTAAVNNELADISTMYSDGMRNIVVMNVEDVGLFPAVTQALGGSGSAQTALNTLASSLAASYNAQLAAGLTALATSEPFNYNIVDAYGFMDSAVSNPSAYGYTNTTAPVWNGNFFSATSGVLSSSDPTIQNQSLFFDPYHLTETGQANLASIADAELNPTFVSQADLTTGINSVQVASAYGGTAAGLFSEFAAVTPDNVGLFATTPGVFLQTGAGNNILVANSGTNVLATSGGSSYFVSGSGADTIATVASATVASWNEIENFHAGDVLKVDGYQPGVSQVLWTTVPGVDGAVLNINVAGTGPIWSSHTFLGASLSTAEHYKTAVDSSDGGSTFTVVA